MYPRGAPTPNSTYQGVITPPLPSILPPIPPIYAFLPYIIIININSRTAIAGAIIGLLLIFLFRRHDICYDW